MPPSIHPTEYSLGRAGDALRVCTAVSGKQRFWRPSRVDGRIRSRQPSPKLGMRCTQILVNRGLFAAARPKLPQLNQSVLACDPWALKIRGKITMRLRLGGALAALCLLSGFDSQTGQASSLVDLQRDGQLRIAGRALRCGGVRNVLDAALPNLGLAAPGVLVLNPHLLNRQSNTVRLFVFHHECGHHHVGSSEIGADCWAVKQGVRQGWIGQQGIEQICRSFGNRACDADASVQRRTLRQPPAVLRRRHCINQASELSAARTEGCVKAHVATVETRRWDAVPIVCPSDPTATTQRDKPGHLPGRSPASKLQSCRRISYGL